MPTNRTVDILMVDDREDGLIALEALLADEMDYRLVKAQSGHEAIRLLDSHEFAMILLDVQMPILDGFETAEIIRSRSKHRGIPIIFVTAINKDERYIYRGYQAGAVDYVFKPFDPVILKSKVAVFADLHLKARQLREQEIRLSELEAAKRYRGLADSIPHMVVRSGPEGMLEYANTLWVEYTGLDVNDSANRGWQSAVHPDDLARTNDEWLRAIATGDRFENEQRIRRAQDGMWRWHWVKAVPEYNARGEMIGWIGTLTDIHDRKLTESKLREAQRAAESANDAKTHFLANMSHEIRTPLNAIMGFTELLLEPSAPVNERLKSVSIVRRNCHQLLKIVDEILDISKVEAGELTVESVRTGLPELLNEVSALMSVPAAKKGIELRFECASRIPAQVMTDSTRLRQIVINIVGNAIKFTQKGSVVVTTKFATDMDGKSILNISVADTGVGIDGDSAKKIFQPFSQADTSTTRLFGGTGLGLALARRLARAMGGDVRLQSSTIGRGSTFTVVIQLDVPENVEWVSPNSIAFEPQLEAPDVPAGGSLARKHVLLVEDAEDNQLLIKQFLKRTGATVDVAKNGREGIDMALAGHYDIVLMDIQMPLVDGYEATRTLRQNNFRVPIIALTAHALQEERERCLRAGCDGHITKPIDRRQLIDLIADTLLAPPQGFPVAISDEPPRPFEPESLAPGP